MTATHARPLACDLTVLTPEERGRHAQLWSHLRTLAPLPTPTSHGLTFSFESSTPLAQDLAELAALELRCCPFLQISIRFEPAGGPLSFELGGGEQVHAFLEAGFKTSELPKRENG